MKECKWLPKLRTVFGLVGYNLRQIMAVIGLGPKDQPGRHILSHFSSNNLKLSTLKIKSSYNFVCFRGNIKELFLTIFFLWFSISNCLDLIWSNYIVPIWSDLIENGYRMSETMKPREAIASKKKIVLIIEKEVEFSNFFNQSTRNDHVKSKYNISFWVCMSLPHMGEAGRVVTFFCPYI